MFGPNGVDLELFETEYSDIELVDDFMARLVALFVARLAGGAQTRDDATQVTRAPDGPDASLQGSHSIYCEGSLPSRWQRVLYSDQTGVHIAAFNTPRKFCAKVSYGGNSAFNLGAYFYPLFGQIALERNLRTHMDQRSRPIQDSDRVFCTLRCRAIPPPPEEVLYDISYARFQLPYLEDPNMQSLRYTIVPPEVVHAPTRQVRVLTSREADDARALGRQYAFSFENIKAAPQYGTNLRCRGPLPPDPWPAPFNAIDPEEIDEQSPDKPFDSITKMCAALWFGGDARGNAGMTCRIGPEGQTVLTMESYLAQ
ncbi:MAG: hypothetical protein M1814_000590 [Vezdaea aestivalis]|nr:MAG: hypothetical protein M1814_000590 [Vezdaea aestivalis]